MAEFTGPGRPALWLCVQWLCIVSGVGGGTGDWSPEGVL